MQFVRMSPFVFASAVACCVYAIKRMCSIDFGSGVIMCGLQRKSVLLSQMSSLSDCGFLQDFPEIVTNADPTVFLQC